MRTCRHCGKNETQVPFPPKGSLCIEGRTLYMRDYRRRNRAKITKQIMGWKRANHAHYRTQQNDYHNNRGGAQKQKKRFEKNPRVFMCRLVSRIVCLSANPGPHDPKSGPRCDCDIDLDYVMSLWEQQGGRCALTKMPMLHIIGDLRSVSIDRIDPKQGHIRGNIQLVCQWVNYAKRHYPNEVMISILNEFKNAQD